MSMTDNKLDNNKKALKVQQQPSVQVGTNK